MAMRPAATGTLDAHARPSPGCAASAGRRAALAALAAAAGGVLGVPGAAVARDAFEWRPWPRERRVPPLRGRGLDGGPEWRLEAHAGRVVLANFWASWCAPCRDEMPSLAELSAQRGVEGLVAVTLNYREAPAVARRFMASLGIGLPVLLDTDGELAAAYTPRIFPSTVLFDRESRPVGTVVGEIDWQGPAARALLEPLLAPRAARA